MKKHYVEIFSLAFTAICGVVCLYMAMLTYRMAYRKLKAQVDNATNAH